MPGLFNPCRTNAQVGIVRDRFADKQVELLIIERNEPVVADAPGCATSLPGRRKGDVCEGLLADIGGFRWRFGGATSEQGNGDQTGSGYEGLHVRLMQFQDQPIQLGANTNDDLAQDLNGVTTVGEDSACATRSRSEKNIFVLAVWQEANREAVRRDRGNASGWHHVTNGQLPLGGRPHNRVHSALHDPARIHLEGDLRLLAGLDLADFVLLVDGENPLFVLDEVHGWSNWQWHRDGAGT